MAVTAFSIVTDFLPGQWFHKPYETSSGFKYWIAGEKSWQLTIMSFVDKIKWVTLVAGGVLIYFVNRQADDES